MNNSIDIYRARIGSFNNLKIGSYEKLSQGYSESVATYKLIRILLFMIISLVFLPISSHIINVTRINKSFVMDMLENLPCLQLDNSSLLQTSSVWMFLLYATSSDLLPIVLFSMVSNFQNRYLYGNKRSENFHLE